MLCLPIAVFTQNDTGVVARVTSGFSCPAPKPEFFYSLCSGIATQDKIDDEGSVYKFEIEKDIDEVACVNRLSDSEIEKNDKIRRMWVKYNGSFVCDSGDFGVSNGSILKYAVDKKFEHFIRLAANVWKLPLNTVDSSDGRTTLDYVQAEWERYRGTASEIILRRYYSILERAGATHRKYQAHHLLRNAEKQ